MDLLLQKYLAGLIRRGNLVIRTASGRTFQCGDGTGKSVTIHFLTQAAQRRLLLDPTMAFGELYTDGLVKIEGGSILDVLMIALQNFEADNQRAWLSLMDRVRMALKRYHQWNDAQIARANVAHHYDLGNQLYEMFLDQDMQYSCAYFEHPGQSLEDAQLAKKRHIAAKLLVDPHHSVLDIGCGWGGMALYLASVCGADATGITLSQQQLARAGERAVRAGLTEHVRFKMQDYRQMQGSFDRIVSVGMLEHVGAPHFDSYFRKVAELLKDDGVALIHLIGRPDGAGITNPWITKYIFPGGYIPALSELAPSIERAGLIISDLEVLRLHYADTLKAWRERFMARWADAASLYDERFCRMWEFYLAGSEAGFRLGQQVIFQFQLTRRVDAVPVTRDYIAQREAELRLREAGGRSQMAAE